MKLVTENELVNLTGKAWRTITARLREAGLDPVKQDGRSKFYASDKALDAIYAADVDSGDLDLQTERARLAKWQADRTEQEVLLRSGKMLERDAVDHWIGGMLSTIKTRLVQVPDAVSQYVDQQHAVAVSEAVRRFIYEALADLAAESEHGAERVVEGTEATADTDGEPVGGHVPEIKQRKQRRTGSVAN